MISNERILSTQAEKEVAEGNVRSVTGFLKEFIHDREQINHAVNTNDKPLDSLKGVYYIHRSFHVTCVFLRLIKRSKTFAALSIKLRQDIVHNRFIAIRAYQTLQEDSF